MTVSTGTPLAVRSITYNPDAIIGAWTTREGASAALSAYRECGLNMDRNIEVHRAETRLSAFWVVGRPDHNEGVTYLMTRTGAWMRGRLIDQAPCYADHECTWNLHPVPWEPLTGEVWPPTVTHTYTYSAGSVPLSDGRGNTLMSGGSLYGAPVERLGWLASVWCIACTWSRHDDDESSVRASARHHRNHPEQYAAHATPRRRPTIQGVPS